MPKKENLAAVGLLAAVYFVAGRVGLSLAFVHPSASPVWPPTGIAIAALLVLGPRVWPGVLVGAFLVNVTTSGAVAASLGISLGNTLEAVAAAWLVNRFASGRNCFERAENTLLFALLACLLSTAISASLGVTSLALGGLAPWSDYWSIWFTWWLGDAAGAAVIAPLLILWSSKYDLRWNTAQFIEGLFLVEALLFVCYLIFLDYVVASQHYPLEYLCIPFLVWAAFRFGQRAAASAVFLMSVIAVWGTFHGFGPFARETRNESFLLLQAFVGIVAVITLAFAAAFAEWGRAEKEAHELAERARAGKRFRSLLESAPDGMVIVDGEGRIVMVNLQAEKLFGYERAELMNQPIELLVPERVRSIHVAHRSGFSANPTTRSMGKFLELSARRKDGSEFPVDVSLSPLKTDEGLWIIAAIRDTTERKEAESLLRDLSARMLRLQEEERRKVARELHDSTAQLLAAILINLNQLEGGAATKEERGRQILEETIRLAEQCERETRTLSYLLHPPLLEEIGLASALVEYGHGFSLRSGIRTTVEVDADSVDQLSYDARLALFRIAQEGLTNIHRHSRSPTASVRLHCEADVVWLEVIDQGEGIPEDMLRRIQQGTASLGVGLLGMRDRLRQLGGRLEINSGGIGTALRATIPLPRAKG